MRELEGLERRLAGRIPGLMDASGKFAVLVPLVNQGGEPHLIYEVRAASLRRQPSEICFPGGRIEAGETPTACALRETEEELGIPATAIHVLGALDFIAHRANFILHPILAQVEEEALHHLSLNRAEVERLLLVPLSYLRENPAREYRYPLAPNPSADFPYELLGIDPSYRWQPGEEIVPLYQWEDYPIWGITGRVTRHLMALLEEDPHGL